MFTPSGHARAGTKRRARLANLPPCRTEYFASEGGHRASPRIRPHLSSLLETLEAMEAHEQVLSSRKRREVTRDQARALRRIAQSERAR
jgi:hypothetical protein